MAGRHATNNPIEAAPRQLLLSGWNKLMLAVCLGGLVLAWLVFASIGLHAGPGGSAGPAGSGGPVAGSTVPMSVATVSAAPSPSASVTEPVLSPSGETASVAPQTSAPQPPPAVQTPVASVPQRISYPAAQMDVVVHPLQPSQSEAASQSIVPPETMDGYWLTPFGVPGAGSTNTTYVVGHSWDGIGAPFNNLSTSASPGDTLTVQTATGALAYKVDSVTTYTKQTLKDSDVWTVVPNRLVLISCYTADLWGKNVVVVASPTTAG